MGRGVKEYRNCPLYVALYIWTHDSPMNVFWTCLLSPCTFICFLSPFNCRSFRKFVKSLSWKFLLTWLDIWRNICDRIWILGAALDSHTPEQISYKNWESSCSTIFTFTNFSLYIIDWDSWPFKIVLFTFQMRNWADMGPRKKKKGIRKEMRFPFNRVKRALLTVMVFVAER